MMNNSRDWINASALTDPSFMPWVASLFSISAFATGSVRHRAAFSLVWSCADSLKGKGIPGQIKALQHSVDSVLTANL
jgi:hypothetical protein